MRLARSIAFLVSLILCALTAQAAPRLRVVMIVVDGISLDDISSGKLPALQQLGRKGGIGVMNVNVNGRKCPESAYLTIGAGSRAVGDYLATQAFDANEKLEEGLAGDIFQRISGLKVKSSNAVQIGAALLAKDNAKTPIQAVPGALGQALHEKRLRTAVIGNGDDPEHLVRLGAVIAMDTFGLVDYGAIGPEISAPDADSPLGLRIDPTKLLNAFRLLSPMADLIVIDTGDTARVERARNETLESALLTQRDAALARTDKLLASLLGEIDLNMTQVMVVTPCPPAPDVIWDTLPPIVMAGKGIPPGLLISGGTHTPGLIANIDIAPTVLAAFDIPAPAEMQGRPAFTQPDRQPLETLSRFSTWATLNYRVRIPIMVFCAVLVVLAITLTVAALVFRERVAGWVPILARVLLVATMTIPVAALIPPVITISDVKVYYAAWIAALAGLTAICFLIGRRSSVGAPMTVLAITGGAILVDALAGSPLVSHSVLAACPITGIRYYGMGNEYMGALIGSMLICCAFLFGRKLPLRGIRLALAILILAVCVLAIGAPGIGANAGGALAAVPGFGLLVLALRGYAVTRRRIGWLLVGSACVMTFFVFTDLARNPQQQTHIGQVASQVGQSGYQVALQIALRKLSMNFALITGTAGTWILIGLVPAVALWFYVLKNRAMALLERNEWLRIGCNAAGLTIPLALIFNDSGIVPAAIIASSAVMPWLWLMTERETP